MTTSTPEKQDGLKALTQAINKIEDTITSMGGVFAIQMAVSICISVVNTGLTILLYKLGKCAREELLPGL
jgi:hypothetical protein